MVLPPVFVLFRTLYHTSANLQQKDFFRWFCCRYIDKNYEFMQENLALWKNRVYNMSIENL